MSLPVRSSSFEVNDPDEARAHIESAYAPVKCVPLSGSRFHLECRYTSVGTAVFFHARCETSNRYLTESAFDGYLIALPVGGTLGVMQRPDLNIESGLGSGLVFDARSVVAATHSSNLHIKAAAVSSESMHHALSAALELPVIKRIEFASHLPSESFAARTFGAISESFLEGLSGSAPLSSAPIAVMRMKQTLINLLIESIPHNYSEQLRQQPKTPAPRQVELAIEFMRSHLMTPVTMADVAKAVGTSQRTLQVGFRRYKSMSPNAYMRSLRLQGARAELLCTENVRTIAETAHRWGFFHLGIFAEQYRHAFGERPSDTLRRSRTR